MSETVDFKIKKEIKGFTHKIKAFTQVFKKLLFPFIYLLVWVFSKTKSKSKRKETVRRKRIERYVVMDPTML